MLVEAARQGNFLYNTSSGVQSVNLFTLAANNNQLATPDPVVAKLLSDIRTASLTTGTFTTVTNPSIQTFTWQQVQTNLNRYPTVRLDFNLPANQRLSFSTNYQHILAQPDGATNSREPRYPGFPAFGIQDSVRYTWQTSLRSTLGGSMVNEARVGMTGGATEFNPNYSTGMWSGGSSGVANTNGYQLNINRAMALANAASSTTPSAREAKTFVIEDSLNWVKGNHNFNFGGSFTKVDLWLQNQTLVPTVDFGLATGDAALGMFTPANFPGAATADITNAQNLYAVLTGRVTSITREARIDASTDKYVLLGQSKAQGRMHDMGFYAQDSWRLRKNLTLNLGLRYELQLPFYPINNSYSTATIEDVWGATGVGPDFVPGSLVTNLGYLFQPGVLKGATPTYKQFAEGTKGYNTDLNNLAPNIGAAWTPYVDSGWLRGFLGNDGDTVLRAGFSTAFQRNGMGDFSDVFGANPGISLTANRTQAEGTLGSVPVLFRDSGALYAPPYPESRTYPMAPTSVTGSVNIFDPNLQVPFARTWSVGYQRALTRDTALEIRYVGAHNYDGWTTYNYDEINIIENGFLNEFKLAQANLQANIAAGRGNTFRYFGAGTGTSPLPIYVAYFSGVPASQAGDATKYTSSNFGSSTYYDNLALLNPIPFTAAGTDSAGLMGSSTFRANAIAAGLPSNFFLANPDLLGGANITGNGGYTKYNGITVEARRRLSKGLQFGVAYTYGISNGSSRLSFRKERIPTAPDGNLGGVEHALKMNWVYELPSGRGRKWLNDMKPGARRHPRRVEISMARAASRAGRLLDFGNVRMVGFTEKDIRGMFSLRETARLGRQGPGLDAASGRDRQHRQGVQHERHVFDRLRLARRAQRDGISRRRTASTASRPSPAAATAAPARLCRGPMVSRFDMSVSKVVPIKGRVNFEFQAQVFNVFNR